MQFYTLLAVCNFIPFERGMLVNIKTKKMNSFNVYKCQKCGEYYHIPCLFVQDVKQKGEEDLCPKCKNHTGKLDKADVYRGIHDDYLKSIGK
jgi:predicted SprT family Zn-dependent metalloprotease